SRTRASASSSERVPSRRTSCWATAQVGKWTCESVKPGTTHRPRRSTRSGLGSAVSCVPTPPAIVSPAIARPRTVWRDGSSVLMTPFSRITRAEYAELDLAGTAQHHRLSTEAEEVAVATDWYMEGPYVKNCNCDPGCPC